MPNNNNAQSEYAATVLRYSPSQFVVACVKAVVANPTRLLAVSKTE